jgi:hypothetical protein
MRLLIAIAAMLLCVSATAHGQAGSAFGVNAPMTYPSSGVPSCQWSIAERCKAAPQQPKKATRYLMTPRRK